MIRRNRKARRGAAAVETAIACTFLIPVLLGTLVVGLGVFRYHQVNALAWESARWASLRDPKYPGNPGGLPLTSSDVLNHARSMAVGMDQAKLAGNLVMQTQVPSPSATVELTYQWVPEVSVLGLQPIVFKVKAVAPIPQ